MTTCTACISLALAVQNAQAEGKPEKERIMRRLLDQHQAQHRQQAVVVWKDGVTWQVSC